VPDLPNDLSVERLRRWAEVRSRDHGMHMLDAQHQIAREFGFCCWWSLVAYPVPGTEGLERVLLSADAAALAAAVGADPVAVRTPIGGLSPLVLLLRRSWTCRHVSAQVRECARVLLESGADPNQQGDLALTEAVHHSDPELVYLLTASGAVVDEDLFHLACDACEGIGEGPEREIAEFLMTRYASERAI
jgi:hypothetical protein